jgi:hypothetical protein
MIATQENDNVNSDITGNSSLEVENTANEYLASDVKGEEVVLADANSAPVDTQEGDYINSEIKENGSLDVEDTFKEYFSPNIKDEEKVLADETSAPVDTPVESDYLHVAAHEEPDTIDKVDKVIHEEYVVAKATKQPVVFEQEFHPVYIQATEVIY